MLKSILFLLVLATFITTPTQAYEAYNNIASLLVLSSEELELAPLIPQSAPLLQKEEETTKISSPKVEAPQTYELCQIAIKDIEQSLHIKENLLQTIASVESGRYISKVGKRLPWPWTVHAKGKGYYFPTKQEAVSAVKKFQAEGYTNIDVGCMQINLKYHGSAFNSLEEAFDPKENVSYSANFLLKLNKKNQNWQKTAMQYHSKKQASGLNYKNRLETHYAKFVRTDNSALF